MTVRHPSPVGSSERHKPSCQIPLWKRGGEIAGWTTVDPADYDALMSWRWNLRHGYASRCNPRGVRPATVGLHRYLMGMVPGDGLEVDHINGDRLDNRRSNLRVLTRAANCQNRPSQGGSSQHRGVYWNRPKQLWMAYGHANYRTYNLGFFATEEEAARVAEAWRLANMPFSADSERALVA